jgi:two-component system, cell cycle sensor histidine kinase and response regulator CckA
MTPHKTKVLVVEDERLVALDLQHMLTHLGYDVIGTVASADETIARASTTCPDVVLMDIRIQGARDGIETASLLRERLDVPVLYLTAHADEATIERAKRTTPYGYLTKPFTEAALTSAIEIATFKHQMDRRLRERERWFSTTLRSIGDAVVAVDLKGVVTYLNPEAERLLGIGSAEAVGRPARSLVQLDAPSQPASPLDHVLRSRQSLVVHEAQLKGPTGPTRTVSNSVSPVIDDGELLGAVMVFRDVTEEKRLEKRVELADRLASLGTMAASVAHEINNPLAIVVASAELLLSDLRQLVARLGDEAPERAQLLAMIDTQADTVAASDRIARIVKDMRTLSQAPGVVAHTSELAAAVAWAVRATAHEFVHRATVTVEQLAPGARVKLDSARLEQVLVNLLANAAHAIPSGHVADNRVVVRLRREPGRVVVEVSDTGEGMPAQVLKRLFEPFFSTKGLSGGTGLGLSICRGIVTGADGDMEAESQLGKGSVFRFWLPEAQAEGSEVATKAAAAPESRRARILMIDDEAMLRRTYPRLIPSHDVVSLESAQDALSLLERDPDFDIIFCDLMMPAMTGTEFYEALLARAPPLARRVVFMTGGIVNERVADLLRGLGNECLSKPFTSEALRAFVQQRLAKVDQG